MGAQEPKKASFTLADTRKSFKKGVRASHWQSYKNKSFADPTYVKKDVINMLEARQKRSHTMESRVLNEFLTADHEPLVEKDTSKLLKRSVSANWANAAKKASKNALIIKAQYDEVQHKKQNSQSPNSATFPRDAMNPTFLTQTSIPEEAELLFNGQGQP